MANVLCQFWKLYAMVKNTKHSSSVSWWNEFFDSLYSEKCSPIWNDINLLFQLITENRLRSCQFLRGDILKIIICLDFTRVHGHVLKICAQPVHIPFGVIYLTCLVSNSFHKAREKLTLSQFLRKRINKLLQIILLILQISRVQSSWFLH